MMAKFDPDMSIYDNWLAADLLYAAWLLFAPPEQKEDYANSGRNAARSATLRAMMERELRYQLGVKELLAFGIAVPSATEMMPEFIPPTMFASDDSDMDCENSTIKALDKEYRQVRVCIPNSLNVELPELNLSTTATRGGGRYSAYTVRRQII